MSPAIAQPNIEKIIARLTEKGEQFAALTFVGREYSKADLLRDLRSSVAAGPEQSRD